MHEIVGLVSANPSSRTLAGVFIEKVQNRKDGLARLETNKPDP
jgi:hypothetical protein